MTARTRPTSSAAATHPPAVMAAREFAEAVPGGGRARLDGLVAEEAADVGGERGGGGVAAGAVLLQGAHDDPVEVLGEHADEAGGLGGAGGGDGLGLVFEASDADGGTRGFFLAQDADELRVADAGEACAVEGGPAREELVEDDAEGVDVGAGVDVAAVHACLLGGHVLGRAEELRGAGDGGLVGELRADGLGDPEVDDLGMRLAVDHGDEDVRRLEVAVDDALVVGVLDGETDALEELEPALDGEPVAVAELRDGASLDVLHREVGVALLARAGVVDLGDAGVVHDGEGLALGLEAVDDLARGHARLDDLERDVALEGDGLRGEVDGAEPALAEDPLDGVAADAGAGALGPGGAAGASGVGGGLGHESCRTIVGVEQSEREVAQADVVARGERDVSLALGGGTLQGVEEDLLGAGHGVSCSSRSAVGVSSPRSWNRRVRAKAHSRMTVRSETSRTSATSGALSPA